jgi:8-oxo-dGTP diphosphatase
METTTEPTPETAQLTADVVLLAEHDGQTHVMVIRRGWEPFVGRWALPGGYVDPGEKTEAAGRRELTEETGLTAGELALVAVYSDPERDPRGRFVTFAYVGRVEGLPQPVTSDDPENDTTDARWMPAADLLGDTACLAFDHGRILHDALHLATIPR